ncbi:hypothetical protein HDU97_005835 [Phlyctochytrium planicorne]|nr:hypothetical protein HDU97_005835 [Phlyctochytrium planicorne]
MAEAVKLALQDTVSCILPHRSSKGSSRKRKASIPANGHLHHFDGLRGVCAVLVVNFHAMYLIHQFWEPNLYMMGPVSVSIFFILSGRVLLIGFMKKREPVHLAAAAVKRFFRLFFPVLFVVTIDRFIQSWGWYDISVKRLSELAIKRNMRMGFTVPHRETSWYKILIDTILIFNVANFDYSKTLVAIGSVWTIHHEYTGSLTVYFLAMIGSFLPTGYRFAMYGIATFCFYTLTSQKTLLVLGMILADLAAMGVFKKLRKLHPKLNFLIVIGSFSFVALLLHIFQTNPYFLEKRTVGLKILVHKPLTEDLNTILAFFAVFILEISPWLQFTFGSPLFRFFGKISFMVYLLHGPLMCTIYENLLTGLLAQPDVGCNIYTILLFVYLPYMVVLIITSWLAYITVDVLSVDLSNKIGKWFISLTVNKTLASSKSKGDLLFGGDGEEVSAGLLVGMELEEGLRHRPHQHPSHAIEVK